jgi:hypothetical protein
MAPMLVTSCSPEPRVSSITDKQPLPLTDNIFRLLLVIALYAVPVVATVRTVTDLDVWWHLRVGQWIVENRAVPTVDHFALPTRGQPWVAYSWLFEVLVYWLHHTFGLIGLVGYRVVMSLAIMASIHHLVAKREPRLLITCLLTGAAVAGFLQSLNERPWLFTILFTIWTLDVILTNRSGTFTKRDWLLPIVYLLWANIHIQFVYGFFLLGLACVAPIIDHFRRDRFADHRTCAGGSSAWKRLAWLTGLCLAATLINPYHVRLYGVVLEYATQPGPYRLVVELTAMDFHEIWDWLVLALTGLALFSLGRRSTLSSFEVLLLIGSAYLSFHMRRDSWLVAVVSVSLLAGWKQSRTATVAEFPMTIMRGLAVAAGLIVVLFMTVKARSLSEATLQEEVAAHFPVKAVDYVKGHQLAGPLYNHFNWGGYLIDALPEMPVAIDGRTNLHGDTRIIRFERTWNGLPGWKTDPELDQARVIIAHRGMPLSGLLRDDARFRLVYEDKVACVFTRR